MPTSRKLNSLFFTVFSSLSDFYFTFILFKESTENTVENADVSAMGFDEMKEAAKGTEVTFYGWGGDEDLNKWLDDVFAPQMKEKYDVTMNRVPMHITFILFYKHILL